MLQNYQLNRSVNVPADPVQKSNSHSRSNSHSKDLEKEAFFATELPRRPTRPKK